MSLNFRRMDAYRVHLINSGIGSLANSLIWTAMMIYQIEVAGLDPLQLVLAGTIMELTIFFCEVPTGIVADVYSRRLSVMIGYAIMGFAYIIQGVFPVFLVILGANALWGLGHTFTSGAYDAWLVDEVGQERAGDALIRGGQVGRILSVVGILLSVLLGSISLHIPILLGGAMVILTTPFLFVTMPEEGFKPLPKSERSTFHDMANTFKEGIRVVRNRPVLLNIMAISLFIGLYSEAWDRLWQTHMINTIGLPGFINLPTVVWFGAFNIIQMLISVPISEIMRRRVDMTSSIKMNITLTALLTVMILGLIVYGLSQTFVVAITAFFIFSISRGLVYPIFMTWSNQNIDSQVRATVLSFQSQVDAIGQIAGGPPLGALGRSSLKLAFLGSALLLSPTLPLLQRIRRRNAQRFPEPTVGEPAI